MKNKFIGFVVLVIAALVILFYIFKPGQSTDNTIVTTQTTEKVFNLAIKDKKIVSGSDSLNVSEGDKVVIKITTDASDEFHLHGYDRSIDLVPNQEVQLLFNANLTGRFPFELEQSKTELGALEVQPK
jgi:heme/copper-type cytochrome/quinol oxidase subunit 2